MLTDELSDYLVTLLDPLEASCFKMEKLNLTRDTYTSRSGLNESLTTPNIPGTETLEFRVTMHILYVVVFVLSIVGNSMVMHVILNSRTLRKSSYMLLVYNLAFCDLLTPTISIPFDIVQTERRGQWVFGVVMCKLLWPCQTFFSTSSSLTLGMICYDRYKALVKPFGGRTKSNRMRLWILLIHLTSFLLITPYVAVLHFKQENHSCEEEWPDPAAAYARAYTMTLFLVQYAVPLVFMAVMYSITLFSLFSSTGRVLLLASSAQNGNWDASTRRMFTIQRKKQNLRVTKMFIVVVVVFGFSMFPNQVLWLWDDYGKGYENANFNRAAVTCRLFTYSNSILNPIIYCFCSREFRSGFAKIGAPISRRKLAGNKPHRRHAGVKRLAVNENNHTEINDEYRSSNASVRGTVAVEMETQGLSLSLSARSMQEREGLDNTSCTEPFGHGSFVLTFNDPRQLMEHLQSLPESNV